MRSFNLLAVVIVADLLLLSASPLWKGEIRITANRNNTKTDCRKDYHTPDNWVITLNTLCGHETNWFSMQCISLHTSASAVNSPNHKRYAQGDISHIDCCHWTCTPCTSGTCTYKMPTVYSCPLESVDCNRQVIPGEAHSTSASREQAVSERSGSLGKRGSNRGNEDDEPTPKRGRTAKYHNQCGDCTLWAQSGANPPVIHRHPKTNMRHPGPAAQSLSSYASYAGVKFRLDEDSCICWPCLSDFRRNCHNKENTTPRWHKVLQELVKFNVQLETSRHVCSAAKHNNVPAPKYRNGDQTLGMVPTVPVHGANT